MSMQQTMFPDLSGSSGFRLHYMQVYNWGTFGENQIWTLSPSDQTALLTGANGSGKTTLVDAILTLLVPTRSRFYNQSSGSEKRRSRTEASYVRGAYGSRQTEGQLSPETLYDRERNGTYSVLLACFHDPGRKKFITIGQVRWFMGESDKLNQEFFAANTDLDIDRDEIRYDPSSDRYWKDRLKKQRNVQFFNSFSQYQHFYIRSFGMRSGKAATLFNRTVGIKVLEDLDAFIREEMLDRGDWDGGFEQLRASFDTVRSSYRAFEKARKQLELLEPVKEAYGKFKAAEEKVEQMQLQQELLPAWFARQEQQLVQKALERDERFLENATKEIEQVKVQLSELRDREASLKAALKANEFQRQIDQLELKKEEKTREMGRRRQEAERYSTFARRLDFTEEPNAEVFEKNRTAAQEMLALQSKEEEKLKDQTYQQRSKLDRLKTSFEDMAEELESLRKRKDKIPPKNLRIRREIMDAVGATERELPFVGELLRIKDGEAPVWENAIERVMHNFALRLLVPDKFYREINRFVNENDLRGRLIYIRVDPRVTANLFQEAHPDLLWQKLDIKADTEYHTWLESELQRRFDFLCTDDLTEFRNASKALTSKGLSKVKVQHEKDDRKGRLDEANYVLGWDNKDKIRLIESRLRDLEKQIGEGEQEMQRIAKREKALGRRRDDLRDLIGMDDHRRIDWKAVSLELEEIERQLVRLRESLKKSDVRELQQQLETVQKHIGTLEEENNRLQKRTGQLEVALQTHRNRLLAALETLQRYEHLDLEKEFQRIAELVAPLADQLKLSNIAAKQSKVRNELSPKYASAQSQLKHWEMKLARTITTYRNPPSEVQEKFRNWTGETRELGEGIEYAKEYLAIYQQIKGEKLLEYEARFQKFLNEKMIQDMSNFTTELDLRREKIEGNIQSLNDSLRQITYKSSPQETFIQLERQQSQREEIRTFRSLIRSSWKPDMGQYALTKDVAILERSFHQIKRIIDSLSEDSQYRSRVLDVRNWFHFSAKEYYRESKEIANAYTTTGHLSGGEKAQITYTILGAALAYQFGIEQGSGKNQRSFRFIVVDEAFSKLDPEKSRYLMDLCQQLKLQLLVVTPLDKIHVVEQYIHACHYVENKNRRHSRLYNLTMKEYQGLKEQIIKTEAEA